jgi:hypothetical protein
MGEGPYHWVALYGNGKDGRARRTGGHRSLPMNPIGCFARDGLPAARGRVNGLFIIFAYEREAKALPRT